VNTLEAAFKAGYHTQWIRSENRYIFDPLMKPGDPDGAFWAWRFTDEGRAVIEHQLAHPLVPWLLEQLHTYQHSERHVAYRLALDRLTQEAAPMAEEQKPSVNRAVHYVAYGTPGGEFPAGVCRAAIVTEVSPKWPMVVSLCVLNPTGLFFNQGVGYDDVTKAPGSWHWPERV
jgi:hypothetical protein